MDFEDSRMLGDSTVADDPDRVVAYFSQPDAVMTHLGQTDEEIIWVNTPQFEVLYFRLGESASCLASSSGLSRFESQLQIRQEKSDDDRTYICTY